MMAHGALIVGAGQAGLQLAVSLRDHGYDGPVTLVGDEGSYPYQRPPLSKDFLRGERGLDSLLLRKPELLRAKDIEVRTGTRVTELVAGESGGYANTSEGVELPFRYLALTTGVRPRRLPVAGSDASNVLCLRTVEDARRLQDVLGTAHRIVVVGGGFIGLEAAAVMSSQGKQVTVVEAQDRLLARVAGPVLGEFYRRMHEKRGVDVLLRTIVTGLGVGSDGRVTEVVLSDGKSLSCDAVLVGIGVERDRTFADQLGLTWDGGILVDQHARTSRAGVVAAGDCTAAPNPFADGAVVRLESVQNAVDQAKAAAASLCGAMPPKPGVPWFWSDQGAVKLQMAGLTQGYDDYLVRGEVDSETFSVIYLRQDRFIGIEAVNRPTDFMFARKVLASTGEIRRGSDTVLADPSVPLKDILVPS